MQDNPNDPADPYDLKRFLEAQEDCYEEALAQIRSGQKRSHWMWYIFPQYDGLGFSATSKRYAIKSIAEAKAYLLHPILGARLVECMETAASITERSASEVFGSPDGLKLQSCATLFSTVVPAGSVFELVLDKFFRGSRDEKTLCCLAKEL